MQKLSEHPSYACCSHTAPTKAETHHAYKIQSILLENCTQHYTRKPISLKVSSSTIPQLQRIFLTHTTHNRRSRRSTISWWTLLRRSIGIEKIKRIRIRRHRTFHEPFQIFEHRMLPRSTIHVQLQTSWLLRQN